MALVHKVRELYSQHNRLVTARENYEQAQRERAQRIDTVSYTHLDVYKRQAFTLSVVSLKLLLWPTLTAWHAQLR